MPVISLPVQAMGPFAMPMLPGSGPGGGGGGDPVTSNSSLSSSIASSSGGGHTYALASTNISSSFADFGRIATNATYTIVADPDINIYHTGTGTTGSNQEVPNAGWAWIVKNSDGTIMKSWNGILNGDHGDSSIQQQTHNTLGTSSIGVNCKFGQTCAINDNYAFIMAVFRPSGGHTTENFDNHRAHIFAYKLSDFTLAKVWKVNDFYTQIDAYSSAPSYSSFGSGLGEHGMDVTNDSMYIPSGYTAHPSNSSYSGGAVSYFDISDATPSNWGNPTVFKTPLTVNTTTNIGGSNYSNGNFGSSGVYSNGTKVIVTHATRAHYYQRSGTSFSETSSYTPNYYIGRPYNAILSSGKVAMTTGDQTQKTLTLRDPANSWSQDWQVNLTSNGYPGYRTIVDTAHDKILVADPSHDENGTDDGLIRVFNDDGTVHSTVLNPNSANTHFGLGFAVADGALVSKVRVGGSSSNLALQFMSLTYGNQGGGSGGSTDIDGATLVGNAPNTLFSQLGNPATGVHTSSKWSWFGDNGTKFYVYGNANEITRWTMPGHPYDPSNGTIDGTTYNPTLFLNPDGVMFNPAGTKIIFFEVNSDPSIKQYDLNTAWDQGSIASTTPSATISNDPFYVKWDRGIFADNGSKFYAMQSNQGGKIVEFTCSTPGDLATASAVGSSNELLWNTAQGNGEARGIAMNSAGTKLYVGFDLTGDANEQIFQYDLSTPFDLSTATYNNKVLSNLRNDNFAEIRGMTLVNDTDLYIQGLVHPSGGQALWKYAVPQSGGGGGGGGGSNALANGWALKSTFSGMSNERFYSIGDDSNNNFYASGYDAVDDTILVASYDKDGAYRWSYNAGGTSDRLYDTAVDSNGNMVAVGYSLSTTSGSTPFPALIVKHTSSGNLVWSRGLSDSTSENWLALAVTTDSNDNIYVAGRTEAQSNSGNPNPFVAKLNNAGTVQWVKKYDHGGQQSQPEGIALDSNGDIIVSGRIHEQITGGGYSAGMVFKASGTDGSLIWNKFFDDGEPTNGYHNDQFQNVAITPEDDVLTCGWTNKDYAGTYYGIVLKLSGTDGSVVWQRHTNEADGTKKIAVNSAGKIYTFTDSEVLFVYASDGTLEQEWKITASGTGDAYYLEDVYIDKNDNAVLTGFFYTSGSDPASPFIIKLPATIQAGTTGDFVITAQTKGDSAGGLNPTTFTSYTANTASGVITNGTSNLTPTSVSATHTLNTVTGASGGGGGGADLTGWIATITDELNGYGYPDVKIQSLTVDSSDNIYLGGGADYYQIVVKMKDDGSVISAASFGYSATTNNHRAIAVASDGSIFTAGEARDTWNKTDGHVMRLSVSLTKSYESYFGEGYDDEHFDIAADSSGNVFAVGQGNSFAFNWSSNPKGHIVKHDSSGGVAKVLIGTNRSKSYPQGVSTDGTNPYVILKDDGVGMVIAKLNSSLSSITWAKAWGASNAQDRMMDIDTNSSGESAAHMWQVPELKVAKIDSSGNDTWRKVWSKASTDHGVADGSHILSGQAIKLLSNGNVALLAGPMPWTTSTNKKSLYFILFDTSGTVIYEKEFRLNNASHYLATAYSGNVKALAELSDGKIVFAYSYYTGSNAAGAGWRNAVFKFAPTDDTSKLGKSKSVSHDFGGGNVLTWTKSSANINQAERTITNATLAASAQPGDIVVVANSSIQKYTSSGGWYTHTSGNCIFAIKAVNGNVLTIMFTDMMYYPANGSSSLMNQSLKDYFDANPPVGDVPSNAVAGYMPESNQSGNAGQQRWRGGVATLYSYFKNDIQSGLDTSGGANDPPAWGIDINGSVTPDSITINGTHGDWDISDITDSTTSADGATWATQTTQLDTNMSHYFKNGNHIGSGGFPVSSATVVEGTLLNPTGT